MSVESAIFSLITSDPQTAALIGTRCYPGFVPQNVTASAVTYQQIDATEIYTCAGGSGLVDARFQLTVWSGLEEAGGTHAECLTLFDALVALWKHYRGTVAGVVIQGTMIADRGDIQNLNDEAEGASRWGKYLDVIVSFNE